MAYMSQEKKAVIAAALKNTVAGTGIKYSLSVHHHSTIVCTVTSAPIDFIGNYNAVKAEGVETPFSGGNASTYIQVNPYHAEKHFSGEAKDIILSILKCLNIGNWNNSDSMTDYFDVGHYVSLDIGKWNKPFICNQLEAA